MVKVIVNPNLTEEDVPALVEELQKLSSLNPVKDVLIGAGKSLEPLPAEKMQGSRPRENDVFLKDYVDGALELAQMLGIEDQGTISPSKGLSFRAKNYKFYDFMGYWSALIKRFSANEERLMSHDSDIAELEKDGVTFVRNMRKLYEYVDAGNKLLGKKIETVQTQGAMFEEAAIEIADHVGDFAERSNQLMNEYIELTRDNVETKKQIKKLKRQFFWFAVLTGISSLWFYGTLLLKII